MPDNKNPYQKRLNSDTNLPTEEKKDFIEPEITDEDITDIIKQQTGCKRGRCED